MAPVVYGGTVTGSANGYGRSASRAALHPRLAIVELGTSDVAEA